jgi:hypothetical protein
MSQTFMYNITDIKYESQITVADFGAPGAGAASPAVCRVVLLVVEHAACKTSLRSWAVCMQTDPAHKLYNHSDWASSRVISQLVPQQESGTGK